MTARVYATGRVIGALLPLLLATSAEAVQLHFEAWPTPSTEGCPAPCYQMRMFLEVDPWDPQEIQAIQMEIQIGSGAVPAQLPVPPQRNANAGGADLHVDSGGSYAPWDLASVVGKSPTAWFHGLMVHAANAAFTVQDLAAVVGNPETSCIAASTCDFVEEALAQNRIYLGFMNVTRGTTPELNPSAHGGPPFGYAGWPRGVPFFSVYVGNIVGNGDAVEALRQQGPGSGFVQLLPELSATLLLAGALAGLVSLRRLLARAGGPP